METKKKKKVLFVFNFYEIATEKWEQKREQEARNNWELVLGHNDLRSCGAEMLIHQLSFACNVVLIVKLSVFDSNWSLRKGEGRERAA